MLLSVYAKWKEVNTMVAVFVKGLLIAVSAIAKLAARNTVNSTCNLIVYEPEMPKAAERLVK